MVRFSCFHAHINSPKTKKTVPLSVEAMEKTLEDCTLHNGLKDFTNSSGLNLVDLKKEEGSFLDTGANDVTSSSSVEHGSKSDEINIRFPQIKGMKKSFSLGNALYMEGRVSVGNHFEVERDQEFSCEFYGDHNGLVVPFGGKDPEISLPNQFPEALPSDSFQLSSDLVNNESIFSIGDTHQSEKEGYENCDRQYFGECAGASSDHMRHTRPVITKSSSLPNMVSLSGHSALRYSVSYSRSSEDLHNRDSRQKEMSVHEVGSQVVQDREIGYAVSNNEKNNGENPADDVYDSYNYVGSAKDWIIPVMDGMNTVKKFQRESSAGHQDELPSKDFKIKRIEEWVIDLQHCSPEEWDTDLQHCSPLEETDELSNSEDHQVQRGANILDNLTAARLDGKVTPGMVAVKRYLSSLSPTATTAHLANHGLVVIPFLSAFVSLKELNLSGNAIVRITAGALPRGLHVLNLSKNSISTIEGLRELTRLRVLNLSYNRLLRIGHGLASCSSLKELYLAGNKISEVEGLHRLLKLHVLDLRFNKISTAKCLGQLAANYNSLQAISLEGNPAQKNVGDDQLKKYLLGLLPHLAYFNRRPIKAGSLKDSSDRSARLGISAHQVDRGLRSEHRTLRKGSHGVATHKTSSTSIHGRRSQAVDASKQHKGRHARLPPTGTRTTSHRHHFYDFGSKLLHFKTEKSIRKSRSEGTLAAL